MPWLDVLFRFKIILSLILLFNACSTPGDSTKHELVIFHAGSLSVPVKQMVETYQKINPDISIRTEAAGSVACARKITDLKKPCDVMLSADYAVIDKFLIPEYATWNIKFARNEMVLAYGKQSKYGSTINAGNWTGILMKGDVYYGRSNPDSDPCGYRTVIVIKLCEKICGIDRLSNILLEKDQRFIRPKEVDLIALIQSNAIDYLFIYKSVAIQHGLQYLMLPDSINLANPSLTDWYATVSVEILGKKPGEKLVQTGGPMIYGLTIPTNAPNPE
nr:substrate-binding domain-containing protein [Bacteroidota bacterium]